MTDVKISPTDPTDERLEGLSVHIVNDNLAPRWRAGEIALIDPDWPVKTGDDVLVEFAAGHRTLARLLSEDDHTLELDIHADSQPTVVARSEVAAIHCVVGRSQIRHADW